MVLQLKTPDDLVDLYVGIAIVRYSVGIGVVLVNGGILVAFFIQRWRCRRPSKPLHPSGCFIVNLLLADAFVGVVMLHALQFKIWPENAVILAKKHYQCLLRFAIGFLSVCGSHNALLSVVIDRYIAVVHTMRYKDWMTKKACLLLIIASWILPVTGWTYLMFFGNWKPNMPICSENTVLGSFSLYVWLPIQIALLLSIVMIQICVHVELRRYDKAKSVSSAVLRRSTHKSARVMLLSTLCFGLLYGPYDVAALVFVFFPSRSTKLFYDLLAIGTSCVFLVNPCLYSLKTQSIRRPVVELFLDIRKAFARFCFKMRRKPGDEPAPNEPTDGNVFSVFGARRTCSTTTLSTSLGVAMV